MQPHRKKIFLFDRLRPTTGSQRWTNLHLIDAQCQGTQGLALFPYPSTQVWRAQSAFHSWNFCCRNLTSQRPISEMSEQPYAAMKWGWLKAEKVQGEYDCDICWHAGTERNLQPHCEKQFLNLPPWPRYPEGFVMLEWWKHVSLIEGQVNFDLMTHSLFFSFRNCLCFLLVLFFNFFVGGLTNVNLIVFIAKGPISWVLFCSQFCNFGDQEVAQPWWTSIRHCDFPKHNYTASPTTYCHWCKVTHIYSNTFFTYLYFT